MRNTFERFVRWFKQHAETFDLFPAYIRAVYSRWHDYLWGAIPIAPIILWWMLVSPPMSLVGWTFVIALVVAGYYAWSAEHVRLMPQMILETFFLTRAPTTNPVEPRVYVQVLRACLTDSPVQSYLGYFLRVSRWDGVTWQSVLDEPLKLNWSHYGTSYQVLKPGIDQGLNVCWIGRTDGLVLETNPIPLRAQSVFDVSDTFRFDIRVTVHDCPPVDMSLKIRIGAQWDQPSIEKF
jgi:hypothetical protein